MICLHLSWLCPVLRPFIHHQITFLIKRIKQSSGAGFIGLAVLCKFSLWCQCVLPEGVHRRMLQPQNWAVDGNLQPVYISHGASSTKSESCPLAEMKFPPTQAVPITLFTACQSSSQFSFLILSPIWLRLSSYTWLAFGISSI